MSGLLQEIPQLAKVMNLLVDLFNKHAKKDEDGDDSLSKGELSDLLKAELGEFTSASDKAKADKFFNQLDADKNGTISFDDFMVFTASLHMLLKGLSTKKM